MGASSVCCENLPQMPGRSRLVLFLARSFISSETNTILRQFSVCLTFQAKDPARNHFSTPIPSPATFRLRHQLLFPLKRCCLGRRQCIPGNSAELTVFNTGGKVLGLRMEKEFQEFPSTTRRTLCKHYFHQLPTLSTQPQYLGITSFTLPWISKTLLD